jgi:hypothetical protein
MSGSTVPRPRATATLAVGALLASTFATLPMTTAGAAPQEAVVYAVVQEGLTPDQAAELAKRAGIGPALRPDGSFSFTDTARFARVPSAVVPRAQRFGTDEEKRRTVARAVDLEALAAIEVPGREEALKRASALLDPPAGFEATPRVDHTTVEISDKRGRLQSSTPVDTTVTYDLSLGGLPVVGPGAKQRVGFAGDGSVVQLTLNARTVEPVDVVPVISPEEALDQCRRLYGLAVEQDQPVLGYYAPPLAAKEASGEGGPRLLVPHYVCRPGGENPDREVPLTGRLVPAAPSLTPSVQLDLAGDGKQVKAVAEVSGGTAPYRVDWASSSTDLSAFGGTRLRFPRDPRGKAASEAVTVTVTDANGLVSSAAVSLRRGLGEGSASGVGGAGGAFAEVGIEQTVDEWQCAQDSANGFRDVMLSKGQTVGFDWRGTNAWEKDFKRASLGGFDSVSPPDRYVDEVDAQWYTGHGWSGGFTFKGSNDDGDIVPSDARWGDSDLEWMQLESCQVLRDTTGTADYFGRWDEVFAGLHLLNGFDTNAYCITGGTGRRFAEYLFPVPFLWWELRPAYSVQQAWASMANDLEPAGVRWRTISPMMGTVHNLDDRYWGQGSVGPDITPAQRTGFIAVSGVA